MDDIIIYSTGCPKCEVLKKKLQQKGIQYTEVTDTGIMSQMGITQVPQMTVGGNSALMDFKQAVDYINANGGRENGN